MKLGQEAKSVNSLGSCPKFCLLEGWVMVVGVGEGWGGGQSSCQVSIYSQLHGTSSNNGTMIPQASEGG